MAIFITTAVKTSNPTYDTIVNFLSRYSDGLRAGWPGFGSRQWKEVFLYSTLSRPAVEPNQPPIQWVRGLFPRG
jgi:hypothetical protein